MRLSSLNLPEWRDLPDFGLYMDQLMTCVERVFADSLPGPLTAGMVNSYVKQGLIGRPSGKKYSRASLAQLLMICVLKQTSSLDTLRQLLHPAGEDTEQLYGEFRSLLAELTAADVSGVSPLSAALRAASWQALCRELVRERSAQPDPKPDSTGEPS